MLLTWILWIVSAPVSGVGHDLPPEIVEAARAEHCTNSAILRAIIPPFRFADDIVFLGCTSRIIGTLIFQSIKKIGYGSTIHLNKQSTNEPK
jgi:hypothetical protein